MKLGTCVYIGLLNLRLWRYDYTCTWRLAFPLLGRCWACDCACYRGGGKSFWSQSGPFTRHVLSLPRWLEGDNCMTNTWELHLYVHPGSAACVLEDDHAPCPQHSSDSPGALFYHLNTAVFKKFPLADLSNSTIFHLIWKKTSHVLRTFCWKVYNKGAPVVRGSLLDGHSNESSLLIFL